MSREVHDNEIPVAVLCSCPKSVNVCKWLYSIYVPQHGGGVGL